MMKEKVSSAFDRADEGLRSWLLGRCRGAWALAALTLIALWFSVGLTRFSALMRRLKKELSGWDELR